MSNPFDTQQTAPVTKNPFDVATPAGTTSVPDILKSPNSAPVNFSAINVRKPVENPFDATPTGILYNTIAGLKDPNVTLLALADVFHGFTDFVGSYIVSANDIFHGGQPSGGVDFGKVGDSISPVLGSVMRGLYGNEPVKDVATRLKEAYDNPIVHTIASKLPSSPGVSDTDTNTKLNAVKIAVLGVIGGDALNFLGGGSGAVEKSIIKSTADDTSLALLKNMGLSDTLAERFTPLVTSAKTTEEAKAIVEAIKLAHGAQAVSEAATAPSTPLAKQIAEQFPDVPPKQAESIARRALTETDRTPTAIEAFVQKEAESYKPVAPIAAAPKATPAEGVGFKTAEELGGRYSIANSNLAIEKSAATGGINRIVDTTTKAPLKGISTATAREIHQAVEAAQAARGTGAQNSQAAFEAQAVAIDKGIREANAGAQATIEGTDGQILRKTAQSEAMRVGETLQKQGLLTPELTAQIEKNPEQFLADTAGKEQATAATSIPAVSENAAPETAEEAVAGYWDEVISKLKGTGKTIEVSGDEMKRFYHGDYDPEKSDMYSKASYDIMKRLSADPEVKTIAWLGGGPGAGKSEFLGDAIKSGNLVDVLYDTTLTNEKGARELLNIAKKNGKEIDVRAILSNLEQAKKHTILREAATGRAVTDEAFADRHTSFPSTLRALLEDGTLGKDQVHLYDLRNITSPQEAAQLIRMGITQENPLATLRKIRYDKAVLLKNYARERFTSKDIGSARNTGKSGAADRFPGTDRANNGNGGAGVERQNPGGKDAVRAGSPEPAVTPKARAAQEQAAASAGPRVIRDTIPLPKSVGEIMLENGRSVPVDRTPADSLGELAKGPDAKSWQSLVRGYMYNAGPTKRAHVLDYLATPEFVLEKVGLGKGAEMLHDAQDSYLSTLKKEFSQIEKWRSEVAESLAQKYRMTEEGTYVLDQEKGLQVSEGEATRSIFRYLDGREREAYPEMNPTVLKVAREMRVYLKDWAKRLNLPEDNQISRYVTHIFERDFSGPPEEAFVDPELAAIMSENVAKSVYDPFLLKRTGKPGYIEDVWRAMDAYVKRASRKEAMDPALEELSNMAKSLDDRTYNYVKKLSHRVNMRPTELEQSVDSLITQTPIGQYFTNRPVSFLSRKMRQIFYRGTLGLNFSSALRNLTQGANTYAKLGEKYTTIGYAKLFSRMLSRNLDELFEHNILSDALVQDRNIGVIRKGAQKMDKALFSLFDLAEKINRGSAYFGAKSKAIAKGLSEEEAIKYAKRMVRETQFAFGAVDTPVALNDDVVKTFSQLQSYNIKQVEFLGRMLKQKDFVGLTRWTAGTLAMLYSIGRIFGMTAGQIIPTVGLGGAPFTSTILAIPGLFSSDPQTKAKAQSQLQRNLASLFPAGAQIRKTLVGASDLNRGKSVTPTGKFRYRVGPEDAAQALLFGSSALPQAQKYYGSLGKKKTGGSAGNPFD